MIKMKTKIYLSIILLSLSIFLYNLSGKSPNELKYFFMSNIEKNEFNKLAKEQEETIINLEVKRSRLEETIMKEFSKPTLDKEKVERLSEEKERIEKLIVKKGEKFTSQIKKKFGIELS